MISYGEVTKMLLDKIPEFKSSYEVHVKDNQEVLPHLLFEDLHRFLVERLRIADSTEKKMESEKLATRAMDFIENCMENGDSKVQELVCVSFIESLIYQDEYYEMLRQMLKGRSSSFFNEYIKQIPDQG